MTKAEINKIIDKRLSRFMAAHDGGYITANELANIRYGISKVRDAINEAFDKEDKLL